MRLQPRLARDDKHAARCASPGLIRGHAICLSVFVKNFTICRYADPHTTCGVACSASCAHMSRAWYSKTLVAAVVPLQPSAALQTCCVDVAMVHRVWCWPADVVTGFPGMNDAPLPATLFLYSPASPRQRGLTHLFLVLRLAAAALRRCSIRAGLLCAASSLSRWTSMRFFDRFDAGGGVRRRGARQARADAPALLSAEPGLSPLSAACGTISVVRPHPSGVKGRKG